MSKSIALCVIVAPRDSEAEHLDKCLSSVAGNVDEILVTITGQNKAVEEVALKHKASVSHFEWNDDFAAARTFNFSQTKADWILWLDADDTLEGAKELRNLIRAAEQRKIVGFMFKYKYGFDVRGNCIDEHWKLQFLKNDGHAEWKGAIHEDLLQIRPVQWGRTDDCVRMHHTTEPRSIESHTRNLRILLKEAEANPKEPRTKFYLGRTYVAMSEWQKAVAVLEEYLELSGWDDERYEAHLLIGSCLMATEQWDDALLVYNSAILEKEANPDAYLQKGLVYIKKEEYNKALYNFKIALQMDVPISATYQNPMLYQRDIYASVAWCYLQLGKVTDALIAANRAIKADAENKDLLTLRQFIINEKTKLDTAQKYVDLAKILKDPAKITQLLHTIPPFLEDNEMILALRNTFTEPMIWEKGTLAIYCGPSAETWTPDSLNEGGIGGSETAVVELAKRLSKNWDVTVFNQCGAPPEGKFFDGVHYENFWKFNVKDEFDALWVWRLPELFDYDLNARIKVLDMHDTMSAADFTPERLAKIDKIFVKTKYHRSLYPAVPENKFVIINNGIDLSRFEQVVKKEPFRFCYTSAPNRGLEVVLKMWPKIIAALPKAELHVYYGWNTFYKLEKDNPERMAWMKKMQGLLEQPGVINHGRKGQKELAEDLLKTTFWLYPTDFPEISCITAMEMQAAGVIPVTTGYAALEESQLSGVKLPGDIWEPSWQDKYVAEVIKLAKNTDMIQNPREVASQFSWDRVAEAWNYELGEGGRDDANNEG